MPDIQRFSACPFFRLVLLIAAVAALAAGRSAPGADKAEPVFASDVVTTSMPGHAVDVEADISGADKLHLVITDGGDGLACDWADWVEPRLIGADGEARKLTELEWERALTGWGEARLGQNAEGGPLRVAGEDVAYGIGAHSNAVITYDLPDNHDFKTFKAQGGLDYGGTRQNNGNSTSVAFQVYTASPPANIVRAAKQGGDLGSTLSHAPEDELERLEPHEGLKAQLFAAEPMLRSPADIDVDHKGRVWVCEIVNYRPFREGQGGREAGDRILVLEDTDGDGEADRKTVFYQGQDINSPHGVCVLADPDGERIDVIVSTATKQGPGPHVARLIDTDGDLKADEKEILFKGIGEGQHDHSIHAFTFGPDGRLYFNMGNFGKRLKDAEGEIVVDQAGNEVRADGKPYRQGLVFRCNLDGSGVETLGWNFRNNWMVTVDSFGTVWQSDNDDDGNRGVRINYVMPFGDYGYTDPKTGAGWRASRADMPEDIPSRHWYQNTPGVVPNLLQTGAGSPTGITVYEGDLLPEVFHDEIIHTDAGPGVARSYPVEKDGAGYSVPEVVNVLSGGEDRWYRPSDVDVMPDGSLIVADWHDPGVGGHRAGSLETGRLFRVAPEGHQGYEPPEFDFSKIGGAIEALKNPNYAVRYTAWTALHQEGRDAEPALQKLFEHENPRYRARALWLLGRIEGRGAHWVQRAIGDADANIRVTGIRLARQIGADVLGVVDALADDPSPQVRRECAIALHDATGSRVPKLWAELAARHEAGDRWSVEALGIGARDRWEACFAAWRERVGESWDSPAGRDIIWRSRADEAVPLLAELILDPETPRSERPRYFRALDFHDGSHKRKALKRLAKVDPGRPAAGPIVMMALKQLGREAVTGSDELRPVLDRALASSRGTEAFVRLVDQFDLREGHNGHLLRLALDHPGSNLGVDAARLLLKFGRRERFQDVLRSEDQQTVENALKVLTNVQSDGAFELLVQTITDGERSDAVRRAAIRALGRNAHGERRLLNLVKQGRVPADLEFAAANALMDSYRSELRAEAREHLEMPATADDQRLPPVSELVKLDGDPENGQGVFMRLCFQCHKVDGQGVEFGPDLSDIGNKLAERELYTAILDPSAAVSHGFETQRVKLTDGTELLGYVTSDTETHLTLRLQGGIDRELSKSEIASREQLERSLMTPNLQQGMKQQELIDLVHYLKTLKAGDG